MQTVFALASLSCFAAAAAAGSGRGSVGLIGAGLLFALLFAALSAGASKQSRPRRRTLAYYLDNEKHPRHPRIRLPRNPGRPR